MLKNYKNYWIAMTLFFLVLFFLPPENGLTTIGINILAVLIAILYLWITENTDFISLLALAGLITSGVMTPLQVYQQSFGHPIIMTIIVCMALNTCLTQTGVIHKIALFFITRRFVNQRPYLFIAMFLLSFLVLGLFMETLTLTIIYIAFAQEFLHDLGYKKGESFYTVIMMGILWCNAIATAASPISHALPLILIAAVENTTGLVISYSQWLSIGIPFTLLMFGIAMVIIRFFWRPDCTKFNHYNGDTLKKKSPPLRLEGKLSAFIFIIVIFFWLLPEIAKPFMPEFAASLAALGTTVPPIIAVSLLCIIQIQGKPIARFAGLVKDIPMGVLIFTATVTVLGNAVSSDTTGISVFLQNTLSPLTQKLSPFMIVAFTLLFATFLTNFISNTVTMLLAYSIAVPLLVTSDLNITVVIILIGLVSCFGIMVPSASVPAPLLFGPEHITVKNTISYNVLYIILTVCLTLLLLWPLANLIL